MSARIFISYRRSHKPEVLVARAALAAAGIDVWLDIEDIDPLADFPDRIRAGIDTSHAMLVWWSSDYGESDICQQELRRAWQHARRHSSDVARRVWVLNPETGGGHITAGELNRSNFLAPPPAGGEAPWAQHLRERLDALRPEDPLADERQAEPTPTCYGVPVASDRFTGRGAELMRIHSALFPARVGAAATGAAVHTHGMGGIGKTELAAKYAAEFVHAFPAGVLWLNLADWSPERPANIEDAAAVWLKALDQALGGHHAALHARRTRDAEGRALGAAQVRARLAEHLGDEQPCLVVLDNLPELSPLDERGRILDFLGAPGTHGKTLVTTRDARAIDRFGAVALDVMGPEDALRLLLRFLPEDHALRERRLAAERDAMQALVKEVGGHTLALTLLGHRYGDREGGYPAALDSLRQQGQLERIDAIATSLRDELGEHARSIVATFASSIEPLDDEAKHVLALASCCAPSTPIPEALLARAFGEGKGEEEEKEKEKEKDKVGDSFDKALRALVRASLLSRRQNDGHWQIHALVAQAALSLLAPDAEALDAAMAHALLGRLAVIGSDASQARGLAADAAQAEHVVERHRDQTGVWLLLRLGQYHAGRGQLGFAQAAGRQALALATEVLGEAHPATLISMHNLAGTLSAQGDLAGARELREQVLAVFRRVLDEAHPATLISMNDLAETLRAQGDLAGARELHEQVLAVSRRVLSEEHPATLTSMNNLAATLGAQGDLAGARALEEQVLAVSRRVLGEEHPATLTSMNNLAHTLRAQGDLAGARALQEQVLAVRRRVLGEEHPDTLSSMNNLADTLRAQGDLAGARELHEQALALLRRVQGEEHPDTLSSMNNLAATLRAQGDLAGARELHEQALAVRRRVQGEEHPATLNSMNNLAATLGAQGDLAGARALEEQALAVRRRVLGEAHPNTSISAWNLFTTLHQSGDTDAAGQVLRGDLLWLAERDPADLGGDQRTIRGYVRQVLGLDHGEASDGA